MVISSVSGRDAVPTEKAVHMFVDSWSAPLHALVNAS